MVASARLHLHHARQLRRRFEDETDRADTAQDDAKELQAALFSEHRKTELARCLLFDLTLAEPHHWLLSQNCGGGGSGEAWEHWWWRGSDNGFQQGYRISNKGQSNGDDDSNGDGGDSERCGTCNYA